MAPMVEALRSAFYPMERGKFSEHLRFLAS